MSAEERGFIAQRLREMEAIRRSQEEIRAIQTAALAVQDSTATTQVVARRTRLIALATLALCGLLLGASAYLFYELNAAETRIVAALKKHDVRSAIVTIKVQQWTSAPFAVGVAECRAHDRQAVNPCDCWYPNAEHQRKSCVQRAALIASHGNANSIISVGGHDRLELNSTGRARFQSNENIAHERASAVAALFRKELAESPANGCVKSRDEDCIHTEVQVRGFWDQKAQSDSDRTVTLTLLNSEQAS